MLPPAEKIGNDSKYSKKISIISQTINKAILHDDYYGKYIFKQFNSLSSQNKAQIVVFIREMKFF